MYECDRPLWGVPHYNTYVKSSSHSFPRGKEQFLFEQVPWAKNFGKNPSGSSAHVVFCNKETNWWVRNKVSDNQVNFLLLIVRVIYVILTSGHNAVWMSHNSGCMLTSSMSALLVVIRKSNLSISITESGSILRTLIKTVPKPELVLPRRGIGSMSVDMWIFWLPLIGKKKKKAF